MENTVIDTRLTSYELLDEYFDAHLELQMEEDEETKVVLQERVNEVTEVIAEKIENIEHVLVKKDLIINQINTQIAVYQEVLNKLRKKSTAATSAWKYLESLIITLVDNVGKQNGSKTTVEKNGFRFTTFESNGPLEITDPDNIPQEYTRIKTEVDKSRLRKDLIANGDTDYATVPKVKRLRIS